MQIYRLPYALMSGVLLALLLLTAAACGSPPQAEEPAAAVETAPADGEEAPADATTPEPAPPTSNPLPSPNRDRPVVVTVEVTSTPEPAQPSPVVVTVEVTSTPEPPPPPEAEQPTAPPPPPPAPVEPAAGEAQRIEFAPGTSRTTITDEAVVRTERRRYVLEAAADQFMNVSISSLEDNAVFTIYHPDGTPLPGTAEGEDATFWDGQLPVTGDYTISVGATRGNATYDLVVSVTNAPSHLDPPSMLVSAVVPGSPAEAAGFQVGDGIWSINGQHVYDLEMLRSIVAENEGTPIDVEVVTPSGDIIIRQVTPQGGAIGVDLCDALECDLPEASEPQDAPGVPGMQITEVLPGSPAEEAGFEVGQVIEQMNGQLIYDVETVREIVAANEGIPIETVLIIPEAAITRYVTPRDGAIGVDLCRVGECP